MSSKLREDTQVYDRFPVILYLRDKAGQAYRLTIPRTGLVVRHACSFGGWVTGNVIFLVWTVVESAISR